MNKTHTHYLQSCKFFFTLMVALFFINGNLQASHADLELTMTSPNPNPGVYENVDIEITITNNGPDATNNVILEFPFPTDLPITGDPVETQGFFSEWWTGTGVWTVGTLASGQTETVTLTLFTLAENQFFYGQVVNSSVVDDDSTPNNGTPPTPNEDDEAVVAINDTGGPTCNINGLVSDIECDSQGTPSTADDSFSFNFLIEGQGSPNGWTAEVPFEDGSGGSYTIIGDYGLGGPISFNIEAVNQNLGGVVNISFYDADNQTCFDEISVLAPPTCSTTNPCEIDAITTNIQCFDNGTPNNSNDDTWSFDLNVTGQNTGSSWMAMINGQTYTGTYGQTTSLGLFSILNGDIFVELMDVNNPACFEEITVNAPAPCSSNGCSIDPSSVSKVCDDNGTPNNPNDDVWFVHINPVGNNLGATFSLSGDIQDDNLPYGQTYIYGPFSIQANDNVNVTIQDDTNFCPHIFGVDAPVPCSFNGNEQDIELSLVAIGQAGAFQNVSYQLVVTNNSNSAASDIVINTVLPTNAVLQGGNECTSTGGVPNCIVDFVGWTIPSIPANFSYQLDINLFTLDDNPVTLYAQVTGMNGIDPDSTPNNGTPPTVNEDDEVTFTIGTGVPCDITGPIIENIQCHDNGTSTPLDDFFDFDIRVEGTGPAGYTLSTSAVPSGIYAYGQTIPATGFGYADFPLNIVAIDINDQSCFVTYDQIDPFPTCSGGGCSITATLVNVECDSKGNNIPDDDTWSYTVQVDGTDGNPNDNDWVTSVPSGLPFAGGFILGDYGETFTISDVPLDVFSSLSHLVRSVADLTCQTTITIDAPPSPCDNSSGCSITANVVSIDCNTQGNTNPNDDTWSFIVDVDGTNTSNTWSAPFGNATYSGTYAQNFSLEELPLTGSQVFTQTITDSANPNCSTTISINPPFPCNNADKPDLELSMTSNNQPGAFQNVSFDITVTNTGNTPANGVTINTVIPDNVVLQGGNECNATAGGTTCQFTTAVWFFTAIAPGQTETLTVNFFTLDANPITYYAQVSDMNGEDEDSTPANGTPPIVNEDDEAVFTIGGGQPCQISGPFFNNIQCFDNGTPIEADDFFDFEINIDGAVGGTFNLTTNAGVNGVFNYGQTINITGFPYANLPFSISATDVNDPTCFLSQNNNGSFQPCSSGTDCIISFDSSTSSRICDDNGTSDSSDDTYVIEMTFTGIGVDAGTGWTIDYNGQTYSGLYGQVGIIGPFLINDGNFTLTAQDNENPDCSTNFSSLPPPPCSTGGGGDTDLKLEVTPNTMFAGSSVVVYTATITNEGPNDASGVSMLFDNGSSFGIVGFDLSTGSYSYSTNIWSVGTIAAGTSETIILDDQYVDFNANSLPTFPFFEILTMDNTDPDSTPGNDNGDRTADEDDEVTFPIFPDGGGGYPSDLSVDLTTPVTNINLGETFTIFYNINLDGGAAAIDVIANLELPYTIEYQSHSASQGTFNPDTGDWDVGYIGGLSNAQLAVTVTLVIDAPTNIIYGQLTNSGSFDFDSTPDNGFCCVANEDDETTLAIQLGNTGNGTDLELDISSTSTFQQWGYISFDITLTNTGTSPATGVEVLLETIDGGVLQGGNEGDATAGTFYPVGGAPSHWDLDGVTIGAGQSETLTINCFVLDPATIQIYAEVSAMNETDTDSAPNNGTPFAPNEDDEATGFVGSPPSPAQLISGGTNNASNFDYQYFKIQNIYPNPVSNDLKIEIGSALECSAILQIANTQGREVSHIEKQLQKGKTMVEMNVSTLPNGIYFLKIETEDGTEVKRFLKN